MTAKIRRIELDSETAARLEAWAEERGLSIAELLAELNPCGTFITARLGGDATGRPRTLGA